MNDDIRARIADLPRPCAAELESELLQRIQDAARLLEGADATGAAKLLQSIGRAADSIVGSRAQGLKEQLADMDSEAKRLELESLRRRCTEAEARADGVASGEVTSFEERRRLNHSV